MLARIARRPPGRVEWMIIHAYQGEHLIRHTDEHVIPRLQEAIAQTQGAAHAAAAR